MKKTSEFIERTGLISAMLATPSEPYDIGQLVSRINANIHPPSPVSERDIYIRAMYIVSDAINAFGGKFPADEHHHLAELLVDSPVLIGHRKDQLPVGRNFHAVVETKYGRSWVKSYFYWLRSSEGAQSLCDNIDGGIYKECSIGFQYGMAECSVCGNDMRSCSHAVQQDGTVFFKYRQIVRVLETSLVYRGATPDTSISKELRHADDGAKPVAVKYRRWKPIVLKSADELDPGVKYVAVPAYDGIPVTASFTKEHLLLFTIDGEKLLSVSYQPSACSADSREESFEGLLVGMRGKERCTTAEAELYLRKGRGPVTRLELRLFPMRDERYEGIPERVGQLVILKMRAVSGTPSEMAGVVQVMQTRQGVFAWKEGVSPFSGNTLQIPAGMLVMEPSHKSDAFQGETLPTLEIVNAKGIRRFQIQTADLSSLNAGKRMIAIELTAERLSNVRHRAKAELLGRAIRTEDNGMEFELNDKKSRMFIRPIRLNGNLRYLVYYPVGTNSSLLIPSREEA